MLKLFTKIALAVVLTTGLMAGSCQVRDPQTGQVVAIHLPKPNAYYYDCFQKMTPIPAADLTRDKVIGLIADLRKSEKAKSQCGKDLLNWYDRVRTAYSKA